MQDVKLICIDPNVLSLDMDESLSTSISQTGSQTASGSPPQSGRNSPPMPSTPSSNQANAQEAVELQIDYWPIARPIIDGKEKSQNKDKDQGKNSIKSTFRSLQVHLSPFFISTHFQFKPLLIIGMALATISIDWRDIKWSHAELLYQRKETKE